MIIAMWIMSWMIAGKQEEITMAIVPKTVAFISQKYSIVVGGLEKKLECDEIRISSVKEIFNEIPYMVDSTDLFILYLAEDIMADFSRQRVLREICTQIKSIGQKMIIVGEEKIRSDVVDQFPELMGYKWFYRPIDADDFCEKVKEMIENPELIKPAAAPKATAAKTASSGEKKRVLIVDDDPSYAGMVRTWIKDIYKTDIVTAGMQAISFLFKNQVDIILLDYEMPVVDGPQVFQMLRSEDITKDIPVVFLTGVSTKEGVQRVMELKADGYILKSTTKEDLLSYLEKKLS